MVFHILWKAKTGHFGDIPKIFSEYKVLSPKVVENHVDNVEKIPFCFPQNDVENRKNAEISIFGNQWKTKKVDFWKIKRLLINKGRGTPDRFFCRAFLFRKEKREGI